MNGYNYRSVAKTMLIESASSGLTQTALSLQKLLYFAHGLMLAKHDRALINAQFQAWKYGPVLDSLYHDLKLFGPALIAPHSFFIDDWKPLPEEAKLETACIKSVLSQFGKASAGRLVEITHEPSGPWAKVYQSEVLGIDISDDEVKAYFKTKLSRS